ncbi:MAG: SRPBCC family protein [Planctomycetota bacterium]
MSKVGPFVLTAALLLGCAATPEHEPPVGVEITPLTEGRYYGGRAVYAVEAPLETVKDLLLDFPSQAEFRPTVREAEVVSTREGGGIVRFKFRAGGFDPVATCRYTVVHDRKSGDVAIRYVMTDPGVALWGLRGGFDLRPLAGGPHTLVDQHFLVSAIMMNRERFLEELRRDAEAIRDRAESARED